MQRWAEVISYACMQVCGTMWWRQRCVGCCVSIAARVVCLMDVGNKTALIRGFCAQRQLLTTLVAAAPSPTAGAAGPCTCRGMAALRQFSALMRSSVT